METREINIETYWPAVVRNAAEFHQIAIAENPEFKSLFDCIIRVLGEGFIEDATEYGVERWESMLSIVPDAGDTLETRKTRILTYLMLHRPYTWRVLKELLASIVGEGNFEMKYINEYCKLILKIPDHNSTMIIDLLDKVLPQNILVDLYGLGGNPIKYK